MRRVLFAVGLAAVSIAARAQVPGVEQRVVAPSNGGPLPRETIDPKAALDGERVLSTVEEEGVRLPDDRLDTVGFAKPEGTPPDTRKTEKPKKPD